MTNDRDTTISRNQFTDEATAVSGQIGGTAIAVTDNATTGATNAAVTLNNYDGATVSGQTSTGDAAAVGAFFTVNMTISDNTIAGATGSAIVLDCPFGGVQVTGNTINGGGTGVALGEVSGVPSAVLEISGNTITGTTTGIFVGDAAMGDALVAHENRLVGNATAIANDDAVEVQADDNWWGCNAGPGQPGCDGVANTGTGSIDTSLWLVLTGSSTSPTVPPAGSTTMTASLNFDNVGNVVALGVPDGTPVRFTSSFGTLVPAISATDLGTAQSTFTASAGPGPARVWARLDHQKIPIDLQIAGPKLSPTAFDFGTVANGATSAQQKFKVHVYGADPVTFSTAAITGADPADFALVAGADTCSGQTVAPGLSCQVKVRFAPGGPATGAHGATLSLPTTASGTLTAALTGTSTGAPTIKVVPTAFDWGTIAVGTNSPTQKFTVANHGNANLVLGTLSISGPDAGQFQIVASADGCSGQTITPRASCSRGCACARQHGRQDRAARRAEQRRGLAGHDRAVGHRRLTVRTR